MKITVIGTGYVGLVTGTCCDLTAAWYSDLSVPRHKAFARSQHYGWQYAALMFVRHLVPKRAHLGFYKHGNATTIVTKLSSKY